MVVDDRFSAGVTGMVRNGLEKSIGRIQLSSFQAKKAGTPARKQGYGMRYVA